MRKSDRNTEVDFKDWFTALSIYMVMPAGMPPAPIPPMAACALPADLGFFFSTITACVVSIIPAIPHAFIRALLVTWTPHIMCK